MRRRAVRPTIQRYMATLPDGVVRRRYEEHLPTSKCHGRFSDRARRPGRDLLEAGDGEERSLAPAWKCFSQSPGRTRPRSRRSATATGAPSTASPTRRPSASSSPASRTTSHRTSGHGGQCSTSWTRSSAERAPPSRSARPGVGCRSSGCPTTLRDNCRSPGPTKPQPSPELRPQRGVVHNRGA